AGQGFMSAVIIGIGHHHMNARPDVRVGQLVSRCGSAFGQLAVAKPAVGEFRAYAIGIGKADNGGEDLILPRDAAESELANRWLIDMADLGGGITGDSL